MKALFAKLCSPAGFVLVLLLFVLPFVSISCEMMGREISAEYTGVDVVINGEPVDNAPEGFGDPTPGTDPDSAEEAPRTNAQLWAILAFGTAAAGVATVLIPAVRRRRYAATALASLALVWLVVMQQVAQDNLIAQVWAAAQETPAELGFGITEDRIGELVVRGHGYVLAVLILLAIFLGNLGAATYPRWRRYVPSVSARPPSPTETEPSRPEVPALQSAHDSRQA